jgi:RNA polymerase sigma-70 factor (ECF subfamily)
MTGEERVHEFMRLFTSHELRLRAFALSLIPNLADAEDVMQQANLVIWKKFEQFQPGTDFFAWACRVVFLEAKDFRKKQLRTKVRYGDEFFEAVAQETAAMSEELGERQQVLGDCVAKLRPNYREMLRLRYEEGGSADAIAQRLGRSVDAIYNALSRLRKALGDCIDRKVRLGDVT